MLPPFSLSLLMSYNLSFSKLKELNHNPFLTKQRLQKRVSINIQPQNLTELAKAILVELIRDEEAQVLLGRMDFPRLVFCSVPAPPYPLIA